MICQVFARGHRACSEDIAAQLQVFMSNTMADFNTREATPEDMDTLWQMQQEMYETQKLSNAYTITEEEYRDCIFGKNPVVKVIIATESRADQSSADFIIGFASYYYSFSSHIGKILYVEDIYIKEQQRRSGHGKAMMNALCQVALENNCQQLQLECYEWNTSAASFYESLNMLHTPSPPKFVMEKQTMQSSAKKSSH